MINKKLIYFDTDSQFKAALSKGEVPYRAVVFIKDTKSAWTHGITIESTNNNHSHNYLPLSGGTITSDAATPLTIYKKSGSVNLNIAFQASTHYTKYLGFVTNGELRVGDSADLNGTGERIYHSGNSNISTIDWTAKNMIADKVSIKGNNYKLWIPSTSGGHARGLVICSKDGSTRLGGLGYLGSADKVTSIELGLGDGWYNDNVGLSIRTDNTYFNNKGIWHAGNSNLSSIDWNANKLRTKTLQLRHPSSELDRGTISYIAGNEGICIDATQLPDTYKYITLKGATDGVKILNKLSINNQITSTVTAGTAPFTVTSNTTVANLNADLLDGYHAVDLAKRKLIPGCGADYRSFVILLCSLDNTAVSSNFYAMGTLFMKRNNILGNQMQRIEILVGKNYNEELPVFIVSGTDSGNKPRTVVVTYGGKKYAALDFVIPGSAYDGIVYFEGESSDMSIIQAIQYKDTKTQAIINKEISDSLTLIKRYLPQSFYGVPKVTIDGSEFKSVWYEGNFTPSDKADSTLVNNHIANKSNPHSVTKAQVGLSNVDNTSDAAKPISTATQNALNLKLDKTGKAADSDKLDGIDSANFIYGTDDSKSINATDSNFNEAMPSGFFTIRGKVDVPGLPSNQTNNGWGLHMSWRTGNKASTTFYCRDETNGSIFVRSHNGGGAGIWRNLWDSNNFNPTTKANVQSPVFTSTGSGVSATAVPSTVDVILTTPGVANNPLLTPKFPTQIATAKYVQDSVKQLIGGAPGTMDTIKEIADWLGNTETGDLISLLNTKVSKAGDTMTGGLTITTTSSPQLSLNNGGGNAVAIRMNRTASGQHSWSIENDSGEFRLKKDAGNNVWTTPFKIDAAGNVAINSSAVQDFKFYVNGTSKYTGKATFDGDVTISGNLILAQYWTVKSKDLTLQVSSDWMDTGILLNDSVLFKDGSGTYAITVFTNDYTNNGMYSATFAGVTSVYVGTTNSADANEIILHGTGHSLAGKQVYLRTLNQSGNLYAKLQIACSHTWSKAGTLKISVRRIM